MNAVLGGSSNDFLGRTSFLYSVLTLLNTEVLRLDVVQ